MNSQAINSPAATTATATQSAAQPRPSQQTAQRPSQPDAAEISPLARRLAEAEQTPSASQQQQRTDERRQPERQQAQQQQGQAAAQQRFDVVA